jgi:hypothetical protein
MYLEIYKSFGRQREEPKTIAKDYSQRRAVMNLNADMTDELNIM